MCPITANFNLPHVPIMNTADMLLYWHYTIISKYNYKSTIISSKYSLLLQNSRSCGGHDRQFQQYFSYIVAVSFIDGGNQRTRSKPPTCRKSLRNFITCYIEYTWLCVGFEVTYFMVIGTDCTGSYRSIYYTITTPTVLLTLNRLYL